MKKKIDLGCYYVMINDNKLEIYNDDEMLVCLIKKSNENFTDKDIG